MDKAKFDAMVARNKAERAKVDAAMPALRSQVTGFSPRTIVDTYESMEAALASEPSDGGRYALGRQSWRTSTGRRLGGPSSSPSIE